MPIPKTIAEAPELDEGLDLYWWAYADLSTERPSGFGPGPIPWSVIQQYAEVHTLDSIQTNLLHIHVRAMDTEFLAYYEEREKAKNKKSGSIGKVRKGKMGLGG